ncbi:MAG: hypothetical protein ACH0QD_07370 [Tepidibacillus sp.]
MILDGAQKFSLGIKDTEEIPEVIIYYIEKIEDVNVFVKMVRDTKMPKDNRLLWFMKKEEKMVLVETEND